MAETHALLRPIPSRIACDADLLQKYLKLSAREPEAPRQPGDFFSPTSFNNDSYNNGTAPLGFGYRFTKAARAQGAMAKGGLAGRAGAASELPTSGTILSTSTGRVDMPTETSPLDDPEEQMLQLNSVMIGFVTLGVRMRIKLAFFCCLFVYSRDNCTVITLCTVACDKEFCLSLMT